MRLGWAAWNVLACVLMFTAASNDDDMGQWSREAQHWASNAVTHCETPGCVVGMVAKVAQTALCSARTRLYFETGDGRLPATVAFPILINKGYQAEPVWIEVFQDLGYEFVEDTRAATFVISKQDKFHKVGFSGEGDSIGICEDTQLMNQIPGQQKMCDKAQFNRNVRAWKHTKSKHRAPPGFDPETLVPLTYVLPDQSDCDAFIRLVHEGGKYSTWSDSLWLLKKLKLQNNRGVSLLQQEEIRAMVAKHSLDGKCMHSGHGSQGAVVQQLIMDPLLIYGHKIDFRVFMFVASTKPFIAFYYPIFMARRSSKPYSPFGGRDREAILTAVASHERLKDNKAELNKFQYTPDELQQYLYEHGVAPADYLENYLHPMFQWKMSLSLAANAEVLVKRRGHFAMYGFDIVLDQKLEMKVLEINFSPQVSNQGASQWKREMNRAIVEEVVHIEHAILLLRSQRGQDAHFSIDDLDDAVLNMRPVAEEQADGSTWWYHEHAIYPGVPPAYAVTPAMRQKNSAQCHHTHQHIWTAKLNKENHT